MQQDGLTGRAAILKSFDVDGVAKYIKESECIYLNHLNAQAPCQTAMKGHKACVGLPQT